MSEIWGAYFQEGLFWGGGGAYYWTFTLCRYRIVYRIVYLPLEAFEECLDRYVHCHQYLDDIFLLQTSL